MEYKHDLLGFAIAEYDTSQDDREQILIESDMAEHQPFYLSYLFRLYDQMPYFEQEALSLSKGRVLVVGAGAGCHSLFLQDKGYDVFSLEISQGCCEVMKKRGLRNVVCADFFDYTGEKFDTVLMLMNGIGFCGTLKGLFSLLEKSKQLLNPEGQVLFDSCDIKHLYEDPLELEFGAKYYGEISYKMKYKEYEGDSFEWLYVDKDTAEYYAAANGFDFRIMHEDENEAYLASMILK